MTNNFFYCNNYNNMYYYCYNGFRIHDHEVSGREGEEIVNAADVEQMGEGGTGCFVVEFQPKLIFRAIF